MGSLPLLWVLGMLIWVIFLHSDHPKVKYGYHKGRGAMGTTLSGKSILLGVSGGIAAYKALELVRLLAKEGAGVEVILTKNATHFIAPLSFEALCNRKPHVDMFDTSTAPFTHIEMGQNSDLIVIAPATANIIGKIASGIADDLLSTTVSAATCPVLICPSMNEKMFSNPIVQQNISKLRAFGYHILEPRSGELACGATGPGRLPEPKEILEEIISLLTPKDLKSFRFLITAGPTREYMDPVRFISNPSSGKMGYAIARAARQRGADVVLVSGPTEIPAPGGVKIIKVVSALEMRGCVLQYAEESDVIIKAAAVSDFRPKLRLEHKMKKEDAPPTVELEQNPDILRELGEMKQKRGFVLVGFAAETMDLLKNAQKKLISKNLDMIVANEIGSRSAGFEADTNQVKIIMKDGRVEETGLLLKEEIANIILDKVKSFLR